MQLIRYKPIKAVFFVCGKVAFVQSGADFVHQIVVEIEVMQHAQAHCEHLVCFEQVADICA